MIHLDTSFLIGALRTGSREDTQLREWITAGEPIGIASIAWAEFLCGPVSPDIVAVASLILEAPSPFNARDAELAADLYNAAGRRRGTLIDCMIAAIAIGNGAALATVNRTDFTRLTAAGLVLADA